MTAALALVHGGTVTSRMWQDVLPLLSAPAIAVDLPGRRYRPRDLADITRQDWVDAVGHDIVEAGLDDVVLVGHSSGGYVIPGVAAAMPARVRHLVFVAATVPAEGMRPVDYLKPGLREMAIEHEEVTRQSVAGKTIGGLAPGEPPIETDLEIVENPPRMGSEAPGPLFEPFSWARVPTRPRTFVRCARDRVIPPELQDTMIQNMGGAEVVEVDAGHDVAGAAPDVLARILDEIASRY